MGRRNIERTILSCLKCRTGMLSSKSLQTTCLSFRFSHTVKKGRNLTQNSEKFHERQAKKVKIGDKIYIYDLPKEFQLKGKSAILSTKFTPSELPKLSHGVSAEDISSPKNTERRKGMCNEGQNQKPPALSVDFQLSLASYTREGLEYASILKHPIVNKTGEKPFLSSTQKLTIDKKLSQKLPFYAPSVRDVLRTTQTVTSQVRVQLRNEASLRKLGPQGYDNYMKEIRQNHRDFENMLFEYFETGDDTLSIVSPVMEAYWESLKPILKDISKLMYSKKIAVHPHLRYKGEIDYLACYKFKPCIIKFHTASWKSNMDKNVFLETHLHALACLGAVNFDPSWSHQIFSGVVIRAYADGSTAEVIPFNVKESQYYWKIWLRTLELFWRNYDKQLEKEEELRDIGLPLEEVSNGKDVHLADSVTSVIQLNEDMTDPSKPYRSTSSDTSILPNLNHKMQLSDSAKVSDSEEKSSCRQASDGIISGVNLEETTSHVTDHRSEKCIDTILEKTVIVNCNKGSNGKHQEAETPSEDSVRESEEVPRTRVTGLLNSLKNFWKT